MKLYDFPFAPNPQKVRVYLAEKGLAIPSVVVNIVHGEQRSPEFLARNPAGGLPVLELDDGSVLTESLAIVEYLEELHPEPPMIGRTPLERARVRELERFIETAVFNRVARVFFNTSPVFASAPQIPAVAEQARATLPRQLEILESRMGEGPFVAGPAPTIADCTLFAALEHAKRARLEIEPRFRRVLDWHARFSARPSAKA